MAKSAGGNCSHIFAVQGGGDRHPAAAAAGAHACGLRDPCLLQEACWGVPSWDPDANTRPQLYPLTGGSTCAAVAPPPPPAIPPQPADCAAEGPGNSWGISDMAKIQPVRSTGVHSPSTGISSCRLAAADVLPPRRSLGRGLTPRAVTASALAPSCCPHQSAHSIDLQARACSVCRSAFRRAAVPKRNGARRRQAAELPCGRCRAPALQPASGVCLSMPAMAPQRQALDLT